VWSLSATFTTVVSAVELPSEVNVVASYFMNDNAASTDVVAAFGTNGVATFDTEDNTVAGKINTALSFNGTTDNVIVATTAIPTGNAARSVEVWVKSAASITGELAVVSQGALPDENYEKYFGLVAYDNALRAHFYTTDWNEIYDIVNPFTPGTWYHVVLTWNGTNWIGYANGALINTGVVDGGVPIDTTSSRLVIGDGAWNTGSSPFPGTIDVVRWYDTALTLGNVIALYNGGAGIEDLTP
jgi:hypothetical protein